MISKFITSETNFISISPHRLRVVVLIVAHVVTHVVMLMITLSVTLVVDKALVRQQNARWFSWPLDYVFDKGSYPLFTKNVPPVKAV